MASINRDGTPPHPRRAESAAEFVAEMRRLKAWSGLTFRQLERNAADAGDVLPHSTLVAALRRDRLPREELLNTFVRACGLGPEVAADWAAERRRLAVGLAAADAEEADGDAAAGASAGDGASGGRDHVGHAGRKPVEADPARTGRGGARRWQPPSRSVALAMLATLALLAGLGGALHVLAVSGDSTARAEASGDCPRPLGMGAYGMCVMRLQQNLRRQGFDLPADAWYGPYTKMRIAAFQTLAGLPNTGMADPETWRALESGSRVTTPRRPVSEIERRIKEVFGEAADEAIELADCLSNTDQLWIFGPGDGARQWGLFQFTELELLRAGATPVMALDAEWNIRAAHAVWSRTRDFRHWKCEPGAIPRASAGTA